MELGKDSLYSVFKSHLSLQFHQKFTSNSYSSLTNFVSFKIIWNLRVARIQRALILAISLQGDFMKYIFALIVVSVSPVVTQAESISLNPRCMHAFVRESDSLLRQTKKIREGTICRATLLASKAEADSIKKIYLQPSFLIAEVSTPIASKNLSSKHKASFSFHWSNSACFYYLIDRIDGSEQILEPSITAMLWTLKMQKDEKRRKGSCIDR